MIRVYLDWNVITNLKLERYKRELEFINENQSSLLFPYSPAHLSDVSKSYSPANRKFKIDIDNLTRISRKQLLRWNIDRLEVLVASPEDYFNKAFKDQPLTTPLDFKSIFNNLSQEMEKLGLPGVDLTSILESIPNHTFKSDKEKKEFEKVMGISVGANMFEMMEALMNFGNELVSNKQKYLDFRDGLKQTEFYFGGNENQWKPEQVVANIDRFLKKFGDDINFNKLTGWKDEENKQSIFQKYTTAYLMFDFIGYKKEDLKKQSSGFKNIQNDAEHSFYASLCDYFVVDDKKLNAKSKALYSAFEIDTKVLHLSELIQELSPKIDYLDKERNIIDDLTGFLDETAIVDRQQLETKPIIHLTAYKLPYFFLNFFNYVILQDYREHGALLFTFRRVFRNASRFLFIIEIEKLLNSIAKTFKLENCKSFEEQSENYISDKSKSVIEINLNQMIVRLEKEPDSQRPILNVIVMLEKPSI